MMTDDSQLLLLEFARNRSETVFRELVVKHAPLVHGTALRKLNGDAAAAQDVMQEVFTLLARKAPRLRNVVLSGWLYRQTCRRAANFVRAERRRKDREKIAMETLASSHDDAAGGQLARELDDALLALPEPERVALVLRFLEGQPFAAVGRTLGVSEEAARKRVRRGLDRLEANFRRKGIVAGGAGLLGSSLSGFAAPALPAGMVIKISSKALEATPAATSFAASALLKPLAAGLLAESLVAVPLLAVQRSSPPPATDPTRAAVSANHRPQARGRNLASDPSLESLIRQLKQMHAGPDNVLTSLRREAVLEQIPLAEIPEFMALAKELLTSAEKVAIYTPLLKRWAAEDPDGALTFILHEGIVEELKPASSTNVLGNFFSDWSRKDLHGAKDWLLREWEDERLGTDAFQATTRSHLSQEISQTLFLNHGSAALFEFIQRIPDEEGRMDALQAIAGNSPYHGQVQNLDDPAIRNRALEFLQSLPQPLRVKLLRVFGKSWAEAHPEELLAAMESMDRTTRFSLALGRMEARNEPGVRTPTPGGYRESKVQVTDGIDRAQAAVEAGLDAGLPRTEVLQEVGSAMVMRVNQDQFFEWMDRHKSEASFEELLAAQARAAASASGHSGNNYPGLVSLRWATRISDPQLRLRLSRASFRQLLARNQMTEVPDDLELDPQVRAELQRVLEENQ